MICRPDVYRDQLHPPTAPAAPNAADPFWAVTETAALPAPASVGTLLVVPGIGDADQHEGRRLARVYEFLLRALTLRAPAADNLPGALLAQHPWMGEACARLADGLALQSLGA